MRVIELITLLLVLLSTMFFSSCVSSSYVLTGQYYNPNTKQEAQIDIPVTQYKYDNIKVGGTYDLKVRTTVLGITVPSSNNPKLLMMDSFPLILTAFGIGFLILVTIQGIKNKKDIYTVIFPIIIIVIGIFLLSTIKSEFSTTVTIVNKDFIISSY